MSHVCFEIEHDCLRWDKQRKGRLIFKCSVWDLVFTKDCCHANDTFCAGYHFPLIFQRWWGTRRNRSFQVWLALQGEFQQHREQYDYCSGKETSRLIFVSDTFLDTPSFGHGTGESHLHWVCFVSYFIYEKGGCSSPEWCPRNVALLKEIEKF